MATGVSGQIPGSVSSALAPLRYRTFRSIWLANLFSNVGGSIQAIAAAWLMTELTQSHMMIAMVQASVATGIMGFGMIAGAIADNCDRRRVMLTAQMGMLTTTSLLALLAFSDMLTPLRLLALTLLVGIGTALNSPAWRAALRGEVGLKDLPQAIALNTVAFNVARTAGPAIGGLLIAFSSVALAFAINAASYLGMVAVLLRWKRRQDAMIRTPLFSAIGSGLRRCLSDQPIRRVMARVMLFGFGATSYSALAPVIVRHHLQGDEVEFGMLLGLFAIGAVAMALFVGGLRKRFGSETVVMVGTLGFAAALALIARADTIWEALPAVFIGGSAWVLVFASLNVTMQLFAPSEMIGRSLSIYQTATFAALAAGSWFWGALSDWLGLPAALTVAAAYLVVTLVIGQFFMRLPTSEELTLSAKR
ncbi:MFS transporter [Qipengyuania sp. YG27]|uniref:MFS transporter n=1 Tax=Qipengyuania mesophila TaxID=2867246 RepID=A0ABS7JXQ2_9SPHN|nr:MFS transporter [Qipengyuania mesophila]MBX7502401.1 MFS transporter [Qipengyuania mesophila]